MGGNPPSRTSFSNMGQCVRMECSVASSTDRTKSSSWRRCPPNVDHKPESHSDTSTERMKVRQYSRTNEIARICCSDPQYHRVSGDSCIDAESSSQRRTLDRESEAEHLPTMLQPKQPQPIYGRSMRNRGDRGGSSTRESSGAPGE